MELTESVENDALCFAKNLFSYLFSSHPVFEDISHLVSDRKNSKFFTDEIGKAVLQFWLFCSEPLKMKFSREFLKFIKDNSSFEEYLNHLSEAVEYCSDYPLLEVIVSSSILLELITFLYRRRITQYVFNTPNHWLHMFKFRSEEFFENGGWEALAISARYALKVCDEDYVKRELSRFWTSEFESSSIRLKVACKITRVRGILDDAYRPPHRFKYIRSFSKSTSRSSKETDIGKRTSKGINSESNSISAKEKTASLQPIIQPVSEDLKMASTSEPEESDITERTSKSISNESSSISSKEETVSVSLQPTVQPASEDINMDSTSEPEVQPGSEDVSMASTVEPAAGSTLQTCALSAENKISLNIQATSIGQSPCKSTHKETKRVHPYAPTHLGKMS